MGVDYLYCGICQESAHEDNFYQCKICDNYLEEKEKPCGCRVNNICDRCTDKNKKDYTFEGIFPLCCRHNPNHRNNKEDLTNILERFNGEIENNSDLKEKQKKKYQKAIQKISSKLEKK